MKYLRQMAAKILAAASIIETIDNRAAAADGPVTPTLQEATRDELQRILSLVWEAREIVGAAEKIPEKGTVFVFSRGGRLVGKFLLPDRTLSEEYPVDKPLPSPGEGKRLGLGGRTYDVVAWGTGLPDSVRLGIVSEVVTGIDVELSREFEG